MGEVGRASEFEVKVSLDQVDVKMLLRKLEELGFAVEGEVHEEDHYFDMRGCPGYRSGTVLRFRKVSSGSGTEYRLTYKGLIHSQGVKAREEIEVELSGDEVLTILRLTGLRTVTIRKRRIYLRRGELKLSVDEVECLGSYLEFEELNPASAEEFLYKVRSLLRDLGLEGRELVTESYLELYLRSCLATSPSA